MSFGGGSPFYKYRKKIFEKVMDLYGSSTLLIVPMEEEHCVNPTIKNAPYESFVPPSLVENMHPPSWTWKTILKKILMSRIGMMDCIWCVQYGTFKVRKRNPILSLEKMDGRPTSSRDCPKNRWKRKNGKMEWNIMPWAVKNCGAQSKRCAEYESLKSLRSLPRQ